MSFWTFTVRHIQNATRTQTSIVQMWIRCDGGDIWKCDNQCTDRIDDIRMAICCPITRRPHLNPHLELIDTLYTCMSATPSPIYIISMRSAAIVFMLALCAQYMLRVILISYTLHTNWFHIFSSESILFKKNREWNVWQIFIFSITWFDL